MRFRWHLLLPFVVFLGACSSGQPIASPTRGQVVEAYVATGLSEEVASCVVGMGMGQFELVDLDPSTSTPPATQELVDEFVLSCVNASQLGAADFDEPPSLAFDSQPDVFGDDPELDDLWLLCEAGAGGACDELWVTAPVGSTYEKFGVTCGERYNVLNCADDLPLDRADLDLEELRPEEPTDESAEE